MPSSMASLSTSNLKLPSLSPFNRPPLSSSSFTSKGILTPFGNCPNLCSSSSPNSDTHQTAACSICASYRFSSGSGGNYIEEEDATDGSSSSGFKEAVELFNSGDYYKCHDVLEEALWNRAQDPGRTLIHGILQCSVGFHHLFNKNHRGAMMELGEGLCKLRKMNFESGPFLQFELEISMVLDFIYQTQLELAALGKCEEVEYRRVLATRSSLVRINIWH